jgi:hypothetical protein
MLVLLHRKALESALIEMAAELVVVMLTIAFDMRITDLR